MAYRGEAMGDDEGRTVLHQMLERLLYEPFGLGVERRGSFVENEHGWILEDRARDTEPLSLSSGEAAASVAYHGPVSLLHGGDELMCIGNACGFLHRLLPCHAVRRREGGIDTEGDVIKDRIVEEDGFLADDTHH